MTKFSYRLYLYWTRLPFWFRRPIDNVIAFILRGAGPVKQGPTNGHIKEDGIDIEFGGMCPVQGEGSVDDCSVYYRARGIGWSIDIGDNWTYGETEYFWPDGGYIDSEVSKDNIRRAVKLWRTQR